MVALLVHKPMHIYVNRLSMQYIKPKYISMKASDEFTEKWIQDQIADDPGILGLGDLSLISREKTLPGGGRVDLILGDEDSSLRYEVEIQLGRTDPSHIIRVLEYWDLEKKRNPHCDHVAVLIAEEITSRFFNVISLFNGVIPIIALQMKCVEIDNKVTVVYSKILDLMSLSNTDDPPDETPPLNREYWIKKAGEDVLALIDELLSHVNKKLDIGESAKFEYRKNDIKIKQSEHDLAYCFPYKTKKYVRVAVKLSRSTDMDRYLSDSGLDVLSYNARIGRYRVRMRIGEDNNLDAITELISAGMLDRET
jgi:hypothetical protein